MTIEMIETHCHLDYLKDLPLEEILSKSKEAGISKIITIAVDPDNLQKAMKLATDYPEVYCTQGIHPHDSKFATVETLNTIVSNAKSSNKVLAIGEIGLDYYYGHSPKETQIDVFEKQLQIAVDLNLPVVIHSRDADEDMIRLLNKWAPQLSRKGVIHSFTSSLALAQTAIYNGFYLGFNGIVTFKNAELVRDALRLCPLDKILLETDAPFLTPVPHRGKENAPYYLPFVAVKSAEIKNIELAQFCEQARKNSLKLFWNEA